MGKRKPKKLGRKGKYDYWLTEEGLALVEDWSRNGKTYDELARSMKIQRSTLYEWVRKFPTLSDAIKNNREVADSKVENSFYKSAMGYYYTEQQAIKVKVAYINEFGKRVEEEKVEIVEIQKYQPPIPTNQIFFLKNRRSANWKDKQEVNVTTDSALKIALEKVKGDDW